MNVMPDPAPFLDSPDRLLQLCMDVIAQLDERRQGQELDEQEKQLKEIAHTINKLEKTGVSVPDELRQLKIGLMAELAVRDEINNTLERLADGFEKILHELHSMVGRTEDNGQQKPPRKKRSREPKTSREVLRKELILALETLGGVGRVQQVLDKMEEQLEGKLLPRDVETRSSGDLVWKNNAKWERNRMVQDGILESDSRRGTWELSEAYQ